MQQKKQHIICTRHQLDDAFLSQALQHNIELHTQAFLKIKSKPVSFFKDAVASNTFPLVFTSVHAVHAIIALDATYPKILKNKACFCIEGNTQKHAQKDGYKILGSATDAALLADVIINSGAEGVLHCTTANRRKEMQEKLHAAHVKYTFCEVYNKTPLSKKVGYFDGVMFYSPSQVDAFKQANTLIENTPAFCIGKTTAKHLETLGHKNIVVAEQSDTTHILQSVYQYFKQ